MGVKRFHFKVLLSLISMAALGGAAGCGSSTQAVSKPPIKVGMDAALTGNYAVGDVYAWQGVEMAISQINAKGGVHGQKIQLLKADSDDTNTAALSGLQLLLSQSPAAIFTTNVSPQILAMSGQIKKSGLPTLVGGSDDALTQQGISNMFRIRPDNGVVATAAAKFVLAHGGQKIGIIYVQGAFGQNGLKYLEKTFAAAGVTPVAVESTTPNQTDFTPQLLDLQKAGAKWVVAWSNPVPEGEIMQQIHTLHLQFQVMLSPAASLQSTLDLAPAQDSNGDYVAVETLPTASTNPGVQQWVREYEKMFHTQPNFESASYYDGMMMLAKAFSQVGTNPAKVVSYLHHVSNYHGVGHIYSFGPHGNGVHHTSIGIVENRTIHIVATY